MFDITNNNIISINRGDTLKYYFVIYLNDVSTDDIPMWQVCPTVLRDDNHIYPLQPGDKLYFGVMEANQSFENALIRKEFTTSVNGVVTIYLEPEMTEHLVPGTYYYSIKILVKGLRIDGSESSEETYADDTILTLVPNTKFAIYD